MNMRQTPAIIFITGVSGAGKTALLKSIEKDLPASMLCFYFDDIGIPATDEMVVAFGSASEWQKAMTLQWVKRLINDYKDKELLIIEGQVNLSFIQQAFSCMDFRQYDIILIHCEDDVRHQRLLSNRNQPELINKDMDNWSRYLYNQALLMGVKVFDTSVTDIDDVKISLLHYLEDKTKYCFTLPTIKPF
jgi:dephospho-CoA kinase